MLLALAPSSHSSSMALGLGLALSTILSPQIGHWQLVRQALALVLLLLIPSSHCSPASGLPSPQPTGVGVVGGVVGSKMQVYVQAPPYPAAEQASLESQEPTQCPGSQL